jgi:hypothetical protein
MQVSLSIEVSSGNESFQGGNHGSEIARILSAFSESILQGNEGPFVLRDANGNKVGEAFFEAWEKD